MAQHQAQSFSISIPIEQPISLPTFDARVNAALVENQIKGFDLTTAVFVPGGSLPPHMRLFFARQ